MNFSIQLPFFSGCKHTTFFNFRNFYVSNFIASQNNSLLDPELQ